MAAFGSTPTGPGGQDDAMMMPSPAGGMAPMMAPPTAPATNEATPAAGDDAQNGPDKELADKLKRWSDPLTTKNIADELTPEVLAKIGDRVLRDFKIDDLSRKDWMTRSEDAIKLAMQVAEEKTSPWPNSSNVVFPLMTVAAIQFNARAYPAIVQGRNVVKGVVIGKDDGEPVIDPATQQPVMNPQTQQPQWKIPPGEKRRRAKRVADHMSWQLIEEQTEWEEDTDKLLLVLPIIGCCFRKTYFAPELGRNASALVNPKKLVVNYWARSMETAPRVSEVVEYYPNEVEEKIRAGLFLDLDYKVMGMSSTDEDAPIEFIEQHRLWDLDEDGYEEPYIVTAHKLSGKVARVVAGYEASGVMFDGERHEVARIQREHYYTKYDFIPNPDGGFYGVGFGQLLGPINDSVNTVINMLIDAGTLSINGGGFIGRGFSLHGGSLRRKMGEWTFVNAPGGVIRDAIVPLQPPEPSQVLFTLLGSLVEAGKEIASVKDVLTGGDAASANMQPTTLLALIEQGLKVFTAIFKRIHRAAKREYDKQYRLNSIYLEEQSSYRVGDDWREITRADYLAGSGIVPASDPTMVSDMQRLAHAQFLQGYQNDPLCNPLEIRHRIFEAAQTEDIDKIINPNPPPNPELIAKAAELELKGQSQRVTQIKDIAQAVLYIAQADKASNSQNVDWATHQLEVVKFMVESLTGQQGQQGQQGAAGGAAGPEPASGPAPAPGGPPGDEQSPVPGARKASDGQWYVQDPKRKGKFMRVMPNAAG